MTDLLLHTCCGPCSTIAVPAWRQRGIEPVGWFLNPNIQPRTEHARRAESMQRYARLAAMELVDKLGQTTSIEFGQVRRGAKLDDKVFTFVPPRGADVIGEAAAK